METNQLVGHIKVGKVFFTGQHGEVIASYKCKHINEKSLVGVNSETKEETSFNLESGMSPCGQTVVYIGAVPELYNKLVSDAKFWVQSLPPVKGRL